MFCENCGKKLIRGYQFCMECGTPVPTEEEEQAQPEEISSQSAENSEQSVSELHAAPSVEPINNGNGTLVFCQVCGMHMQTSTSVCEKCGMPLGGTNERPAINVSNGSVPLVNNNPIENEFGGLSGISDEDIGQINDLLGGSGLDSAPQISYSSASSGGEMAAIGKSTQSEIDELARQLESFGASTGDMPAIGMPDTPVEIRQAEPKAGESRELQDFALEGDSRGITDMSDGAVPIIEGGSMEEDPASDVSLDPYAFVNNILEGAQPAPAVEEVAPASPAVEEIASTVEEIVPAVPVFEEVAPIVEEITPAVPAVEEVVPTVEKIAPPLKPEDFSSPADEVPPMMAEYVPPVMDEYVPPVMPEFGEEREEEASAALVEDGAPVVAQQSVQPASPAPAPEKPISLNKPAAPKVSDELPQEDPVLGKLSYCRNCGQDMYEKETACKNCGAPYRAPKKHDVSLDNRLGGDSDADSKKKIIPIAAGSVVACAVIIGLVVGINSAKKNETSSLTGNETLSVPSTTTTSSAQNNIEESDIIVDVSTDEPVVTEPIEENNPSVPETNSEPAPEKPDVTTRTTPTSTAKTTPQSSDASTIKTTPQSTTPKIASTTTSKAAVTTSTAKPSGTISAKTASLESDREKIMSAVEKMAAEVGKIDMLAQNVIYIMENSSGNAETVRTGYYNRDFAKNIISSIDSGKSAVESAISAAKPKNSEFNSLYSQLSTLQKKYNAYYDFIKNPTGSTSKFTSSCSTYLSDFTTTLSSNFKYTKFTSDYSAYETSAAYAAAMSDAITAANNAISAFSTLEGKLTELKKENFDANAVQTLSKSANSKTYANAAAYAQEVAAYRIMLANPPSDYSSAYSYLKTASDKLNELVGLYNMIQENDRSSFSSESSTNISAARSAISSATKEIS